MSKYLKRSYIPELDDNKLRKMRIEFHLTCEDMASILGISKTYYFQLENQKRRLYYHLAVRIARIFNKRPDDIFYDDYNLKN